MSIGYPKLLTLSHQQHFSKLAENTKNSFKIYIIYFNKTDTSNRSAK